MSFNFQHFFFAFLCFCFCLITVTQVNAFYYDTLPSGVGVFVFRQVYTDAITGRYEAGRNFKPYTIDVKLDAKTMEGAGEVTNFYFNNLKNLSPQAYNAFSFGEYKAEAKTQVKVSVFALGWGLTDRLTIYGHIPYYVAKIDLNIKRLDGNHHQQVAQIIRNASNSDTAQILAGITENLPDGNEGLIQSAIVNYFHYKPLGSWEGAGFGDAEVGLIYKIYDAKTGGASVTLGTVIPNGKMNDIDTLQSITFGGGAWDFFAEFGGSYILHRLWSVESWGRYTYQAPYTREIRLPESADVPITTRKGNANIKFGDQLIYDLTGTYQTYDWLSFSASYIYSFTGSSTYHTPYADSNSALETDTQIQKHSIRLNAGASTIPAFQKKIFMAPLQFNAAAQFMLSGQNTPKYNRYELEVRVFF